MKKFLMLTAIFLLAAACQNKPAQDSQSNGQQPTQPSSQQQNPALQTYHNLNYNFSLQYPPEWGFVSPIYANLEEKVVQLQLAQEIYPKTNFDDADFTVSAQFVKSLKDCLNIPAPSIENSSEFKSTRKINGMVFSVAKGGGAAAGNLYESNIFRTLNSDNFCIELTETLHTGNIANYPEGTVAEVNHAEVFNRLDQILNSFKFDAVK